MLRCTRCEGFIPAALTTCPNCSKRGRAGRGFLAVVGAAGAAMTLMACYGLPVCDPHTTADGGTSTSCVNENPPDAGSSDAGTTDAGTTCADGGAPVDGGC